MAKKKKKTSPGTLAVNRKARHDYEFVEFMEAGISLMGSEVKSLREGRVSFTDGYVSFRRGEAWLVGVHISPYENAVHTGHDPLRERRLLLHAHEIQLLVSRVEQKGLTVIPLKFYLKQGKIKLEIALAKGRAKADRREELKRRAEKRDADREMAGRG